MFQTQDPKPGPSRALGENNCFQTANRPQESDEEDLASDISLQEFVLESNPKPIFISPYSVSGDELAIEYYNGYHVSERATRLVENGSDGRPMLESRNDEFPSEHFCNWIANELPRFKTLISNGQRSAIDSQVVLLFGTTGLINLLNAENEWRGYQEIMELLLHQSTPDTHVISIFSSGVVGSFKGMDDRVTVLELENGAMPCLSGIRIPSVYGIQLVTFCITSSQLPSSKMYNDMEKLLAILGVTPQNRDALQGIVIVLKDCGSYNKHFIKSNLFQFLTRNENICLAGGMTSTIFSRGTYDENVVAAGFLIIGETSQVKVGCGEMDEPGISLRNISNISQMRNILLDPRNDDEQTSSFAVVFGSLQRGMNMYEGVPGIDSSYFSTVFPETSVVGGFFKRQFCSKRLFNEDSHWDFETTNSTVYMLVSYRHPHPF